MKPAESPGTAPARPVLIPGTPLYRMLEMVARAIVEDLASREEMTSDRDRERASPGPSVRREGDHAKPVS